MMTAHRIVCLALTFTAAATGCSRADENNSSASPAAHTTHAGAQPEHKTTPPPQADPADTPVTVSSVRFEVPSAFQQRPTTSSMRVAEFVVHVPDDMTDAEQGEIVFFYFGPQGAGGVDANIARWTSQVLTDEGKPADPQRAELELGALKATTVRLDGTYMSGPPAGEKTPKKDFTLLGAVVQGGPQGDVFIRMTGPKRVLDAYPGLFEQLVRSAKVDE
ncbi:MAG: hypothetical protein AB7G17_07910 [Phycisphaerales bacterium]